MALLDKQQAKDILKTAKEKTADLIGDEGKELLTKVGKFVSDTGSKLWQWKIILLIGLDMMASLRTITTQTNISV